MSLETFRVSRPSFSFLLLLEREIMINVICRSKPRVSSLNVFLLYRIKVAIIGNRGIIRYKIIFNSDDDAFPGWYREIIILYIVLYSHFLVRMRMRLECRPRVSIYEKISIREKRNSYFHFYAFRK